MSTKNSTSNTAHSPPPNAFPRFLILWFGQLASSIGNGLTAFALGVYVFQTTGTATSYSITLLCAFLPSVCLSPIGGVLADRYDRRTLIIISDIGAISGLLYIIFCMSLGQIELWQVYLGIAWSSVFTAVRSPAYKATITDMLPCEKYEQASGLVQLAGSAQYLISPLFAGILIGMMPIEAILILDILSFILAIITVLAVRKHIKQAMIPARQHFIQEMKEGLQAITANKGILALVGLTALVLFFLGLLQALLGPMLLAFTDAETFGIAQSTCALGLLAGSLIIGIFGIRQNLVTILSLFLGLMGLFYATLGLSTEIIWVIIPGILFFFTIPFINTCIEVLLRNSIDSAQQGRAWSLISMMTFAGSIIAFSSAGFLADHLFNPMFKQQGMMSDTFLGTIIGIGPGRGIAFIFFASGLSLICLAIAIYKSETIRGLETQKICL